MALSWTAPAEDAGSVTGYEVLRGQGSAALATLAADTGNTDTTYTDSGATGDLDGYRYQVKALRGGDASQGSNVAGVLQSAHAGAIVPLADVTLISNVGQTAATGAAQVSTSQSQAQGFTTGSDSGGYTLGSVELAVSSFSGTASDITVSIYSESSGHPGTVVHTLTTPASISAAVTTFTAPSGATLAASTTYYVVISTTGSGISLGRTNAAAEDTGGVSGWSIADSRRFFGGSGWNTTTNPIRMRVNGDAATSTNSPATGAPTITGTLAVGELLTADISNIGDADGIADADFKYQWIAFDGTTDSDISGATGETYRPLLAHLAQTIKVRVSFDDDDDNAESLTSAATAAVTASTYGQVIWAATLTVEEVMDGTETYVGFDDAFSQGSLEPSDFSYDGNNISVLALYYEDVFELLEVEVSGHSGLGSGSFNLYLDDSAFLIQDPASTLSQIFDFPDHGLSWTDGQEVEVRLTVNRAPTAGPTITGDVQVGGTLTADPSAIVDPDGIAIGATYTYQWVRVDGMSETNISGATASTYTLVADDGGKTIKVKVSYTDEANFVDTATSNATTKVATAPAPPTRVDITTEGNGELTVGWTAPTENGGSDITGYKVQWKSGAQSFGSSRQHTTADGAATSYTIPSLTNGTLYTVRVLAVNSVGDSAASNTDTGTPSTTPSAPTNVQAGSGHQQLTVSWGAPNDGGSAITEYTLQWKSGGQGFNSTRQRTIAGTSRTDTIPSLSNGTEYTVRVRATNALGDSDWSAEAKGTPREGPHVSLVKVKEPIECDNTQVVVTLANLVAGTEYEVHLRDRKQGDPWPSTATHGRSLTGDTSHGTSVSFTLTRLDGNTVYEVQASLDGSFNSGVVTATFTTPAEEPDPPTNVRITGDTNNSLTVSWNPPSYDGGSAVTEYRVQWLTVGEGFANARRDGREAVVDASPRGLNAFFNSVTLTRTL